MNKMFPVVIGPILFGFLFGLVIGTRIRKIEENSFKLTTGAVVALLIGVLIMAFDLGQFPFYVDMPIASAFVSAIIGILIGCFAFGNSAKGDS